MSSGPFGINDLWEAVNSLNTFDGGFITFEQFGAVGNGSTNDRAAIIAAFAESNSTGKVILGKAGAVYRCSSRIEHLGSVRMACIGGIATIRADVNNDFLRVGRAAFQFNETTAQHTTTLSAEANASVNRISVTSAANIASGDFIELRSTADWPHDNRSVAKKAELHKVDFVSGTVVRLCSQVNQTFTTGETTVRIYKPVDVVIQGFRIEGSWSSNTERVGIRASCANLNFNGEVSGFGGAGIIAYHCFAPKISGSFDKAGGVSSGYGVQVKGCTLANITGSSFGCRRGADVSGDVTPSWNCKIRDFSVMGGGDTVNGGFFGQGGVNNYGVGDHGPAAMTTYHNCTITDVFRPFQHRGRDSVIDGATVRGWVPEAVITLWHNEQFTAKNISFKRGWGGSIDGSGAVSGQTYAVPRNFIQIRNVNVGMTETTNQIIVDGCTCEVREAFLGGVGTGRTIPDNIELSNNSINFYTDSSAAVYLVRNSEGTSRTITRFYNNANRYSRIGTSGSVSPFLNITVSGPRQVFS